MRLPIVIKIFSGYVFVCLALAGIILLVSFQTIRTHYMQTSTKELNNLGNALVLIIDPYIKNEDVNGLNSLVSDMGKRLQTRITVINSSGRVLADSTNDPETLETHRDRPEIIAALTGRTGSVVRYSLTLQKDMLYVAVPMEIEGKTGAVIRTSIPFENIDILLATLRQDIMKMSFIIIAASLFIAFFISHRISSPIRELNRASRQVAGGDLDVRVTLKSNDEMRELAANFNDMTEHLQTSFTELNSRKEELESIITSITEALLVIDTRGKILMFNESAKRIAGSEKILGRYFWEVIRSVKLNAIVEQADKRPVSDDFEMEESFYLCSVTPIRSGRAKVVLLHDITEMKRIEEIKKDLVVNVSHELRTPLTAIKGFTETLMDEAGDETREYVEIIQRHTDRLIHIVNDILDLSELEERGMKLNLEKVTMQDLLERVLALFSQRMEEKGLEIKAPWPEDPIVIDADPFRLEQLFSNLIDNALKYTDHGFIILDLKDSPDEIIIRVSDTGAGIPREHLQRIFERFYVVDKSRSRILGGTGLGLSIVKHIVSLHKGTITAQSKLNIGTTFTITLPKSLSSNHDHTTAS